MALRIMTKLNLFNRTLHHRKYLHVTCCNLKLVQFILSDIGEGIREVTVKDWFVKVGDKVSQFDDICLVESDKASVNITSRYDGTVKKLYHSVGDTAFVGKALVDIDIDGDEEINKLEQLKTPDKPETVTADERIYSNKSAATPAVRRIAMENNLKLDDIKGTGKKGRIMKEDILQHLDNVVQPPSQQGSSSETIINITGLKKVMAKTMMQSNSIPSFGYCDEINVTKLVSLREEIKDFSKKQGMGINISFMPFFIKALSKSLEKYPDLNAQVDEECKQMIIKSEHNIGIAIDTPDGLLVPNIKNVHNLSITEITSELEKLIEKAKTRRLSISDLSGGTFTISNIGIIGGTYVRPLINPPEVGIVGIGKFVNKPIYNESDEIIKATVCNVSWTADHRVIDGATMARFANLWREYIEHPSHITFDQ